MDQPTPRAPNDAAAQNEAKRLRLARAYLEVFGAERKRTSAQRLVMEDLEVGIEDDKNTFRFGRVDGLTAIAAGLQRDGAQSILRIIKRNILRASEAPEPKPERTVKR